MSVDRRQRIAAAFLLSAIELPAPAGVAAGLWLDAVKVCPGLSLAEIPFGAGRLALLQAARALIDECLVAAKATPQTSAAERLDLAQRSVVEAACALAGNGRGPALDQLVAAVASYHQVSGDIGLARRLTAKRPASLDQRAA